MSPKALPQGWMGKHCRRWLRRVAAGLPPDALVAEVGSWRGRSTMVMARRLESGTIYAVDTWAGVPDDPEQHERLYADVGSVYKEFRKNLRLFIKTRQVVPLRMDSLSGAGELAKRHGGRSFDLVFIDADHRYEAVRGDILAYMLLVKPGGIISGHDYNPETWPGVVQAVNEYVPDFKVYKGSSVWWARVA